MSEIYGPPPASTPSASTPDDVRSELAPPGPWWRSPRVWRIAAVIALLAIGWTVAWSTGLLEGVTVESIRATVATAGVWGVLAFIVIACLANLLHIPGMIPIFAAILAFGDVTGAVIGWAGATTASMATFVTMRTVGGRGSVNVKWRWVQRILDHLEDRPILTIALLRAVFQNSGLLNTALALSTVSWRGYLVGSALGLIPPVAVAALLSWWWVG